MFWITFFIIVFIFALIGGVLNLASDILRGLTNGFRDFDLEDHIFWVVVVVVIVYFVV